MSLEKEKTNRETANLGAIVSLRQSRLISSTNDLWRDFDNFLPSVFDANDVYNTHICCCRCMNCKVHVENMNTRCLELFEENGLMIKQNKIIDTSFIMEAIEVSHKIMKMKFSPNRLETLAAQSIDLSHPFISKTSLVIQSKLAGGAYDDATTQVRTEYKCLVPFLLAHPGSRIRRQDFKLTYYTDIELL